MTARLSILIALLGFAVLVELARSQDAPKDDAPAETRDAQAFLAPWQRFWEWIEARFEDPSRRMERMLNISSGSGPIADDWHGWVVENPKTEPITVHGGIGP